MTSAWLPWGGSFTSMPMQWSSSNVGQGSAVLCNNRNKHICNTEPNISLLRYWDSPLVSDLVRSEVVAAVTNVSLFYSEPGA